MAHGYISRLSKSQQRQLFSDLNYLNLAEIRSFCKRHSIPFKIAIETEDGNTVITRDVDRKGVILDRVRGFLETGVVPEGTCFPARVVCSEPLRGSLSASDRLHYGQYDKTHRAMNALLKGLTAGQFKSGAIARILAREFWSRGQAPTFAEFAAAWTQAVRSHTAPNAEWAFLSDRARNENLKNWKELRAQKASKALGILDRLSTASQE